MIGFSAQDVDVQQIFVAGANNSGWQWDGTPTAFLFAEDQLTAGQRGILASAYGDQYAPHRAAIEQAARVRAYAKPLLLALLLTVLERKAGALADLGLPDGRSRRVCAKRPLRSPFSAGVRSTATGRSPRAPRRGRQSSCSRMPGERASSSRPMTMWRER